MSTELKTAGDLRSFLTEVMIDIRAGKVDVYQANSISKVASQINQSLALEVNTALQLRRLDDTKDLKGISLSIGGDALPPPSEVWCDQCDKRVSRSHATACTDKFCKAKGAL